MEEIENESKISLFFTDEPDNNRYKKLIKEYGDSCCKGEFSKYFICERLQISTHGFISIEKNPVEQYRGRISNMYLEGFVLFNYDHHSLTIENKILCCDKNRRGVGAKLLEAVHEFALDRKVAVWKLYSLPYDTLVTYYENFGFKVIRKLYKNRECKVIEMEYDFEN